MPTIKGPIKLGSKSDNKDFMEKLKESGSSIKLPFSATGFKSSKMPFDKSQMKGIEFANDVELVKEHIRDVDPKDTVLKKKIKSYTRRKSKGKK